MTPVRTLTSQPEEPSFLIDVGLTQEASDQLDELCEERSLTEREAVRLGLALLLVGDASRYDLILRSHDETQPDQKIVFLEEITDAAVQ